MRLRTSIPKTGRPIREGMYLLQAAENALIDCHINRGLLSNIPILVELRLQTSDQHTLGKNLPSLKGCLVNGRFEVRFQLRNITRELPIIVFGEALERWVQL